MRIGSRVQENDLSTSDLAGVEKVLSGRWAFLKVQLTSLVLRK